MATSLVGGHADSVLCVAHGCENRLLSGGENGELCIWSLDGEAQPLKVTVGDGDVTSICCSRLRPQEMYAACGALVVQYDTRQLNQPVHSFSYNEDEVNQIALNEKETHLAACDDAGHIRVLSTHERKLFKTLRKHTNICSAITFRPRRPWELISGGLDSLLLQWDFSKAKNFCSINMEEIGDQSEETQDSYLVNPPFVHSVSMSPDGTMLACGTENANVQVFDSSKRTLEYRRTLRLHTQGVSQVHFVQAPDGAAGAVSDNTALLLSAGNDGKIALWDIKHETDTTIVNGHAGKLSAAAANAETAAGNTSDRYLRGEIIHGEKINWITSYAHQAQTTIAVADNSSKISLYPLPS